MSDACPIVMGLLSFSFCLRSENRGVKIEIGSLVNMDKSLFDGRVRSILLALSFLVKKAEKEGMGSEEGMGSGISNKVFI
jgi:hypothetical protein